jgi:hypothetical protein
MKTYLEKIKKNHAFAMILCCAIPIVGILALSSLGILGSWGYIALILICFLGHIFMMRSMHSTSKTELISPQKRQMTPESSAWIRYDCGSIIAGYLGLSIY